MALSKKIRWFFYSAAGLAGLLLVLLLVVSLVRLPINLEGQKGLIESVASRSIDRQVKIDGAIQVTTSLWPVFIIKDVHIKNPEGFQAGDFARLESAKIEIGLIQLLLGKIKIKDCAVSGLKLALMIDEKENVNWAFNNKKPDLDKPKENPADRIEKQTLELSSDSLVIDKLNLDKIALTYFKPGMEKPSSFKIDKGSGSALAGEAFQITLQGSTLEEPYNVSIRVASLKDLLDDNKSWFDIETSIAQALINFSGHVNLAEINRNLQFKLEIKGEGLDNFNRLLNVDLPPVPSYTSNASLSVQKGLVKLTDLKLSVSNSVLTGSLKINLSGPVPEADLELQSPQIKLNDFVFEDWSPLEETTDEEAVDKPEEVAEPEKAIEKQLEALSPEFLKKFNASIAITAENILSGEDRLGGGQVSISLMDGRISLDPLDLDLPGGSLSLSMSLKPGKQSSDASLRVKVENFDLGILARRSDPNTDMGGVFNVDIDLNSSAKDFTELLENGNGHFDFSAKPENLKSGIMDLWAINVVSAIVSSAVKGQSHIEYLLGRWSMKDGYLKPDVFVIDTTRMRICGKGWVDFNTNKLSLEVSPTPKEPEFFSLATPINVQGDFTDFGLKIAPGGLVGTGVSFAISPLQVPLQTLFSKPIPSDGSDIWAIPIGPENRDVKRPAGCR